jgi:AraC family transcriptional regulator
MDYNHRVLRVLLYIQQHLDEALSVDSLAKVAKISPYHFHRLFSGMVGEPLLVHVRRLRIERAALQLRSSERGISQIAFNAGYETHESFSRAFKSFFKVSPSEYRAKNRLVPKAEAPSGVHYNVDGWVDNFHPVTEGVTKLKVEIIQREEMRVAFFRHIGPYDKCGAAWEKLLGWAGSKGLLNDNSVCIGAGYDDPDVTDPDRIRYDACIEVDKSVPEEEGIGIQTLKGGTYAKMVHHGSYDALKDIYKSFYVSWLPKNGYVPGDGPGLERYVTDPSKTAPEDNITEIYILVAKR